MLRKISVVVNKLEQELRSSKAEPTGGGLGVEGFCLSSGEMAVKTKLRDDREPFGFATDFTISATFASVSGLRLRNEPCVIFCRKQ